MLYSRIFLGAMFFLSSLGKVTDVKGFAVAVGDYKMLPESAALPFAYTLSWTELVLGVILLFGVRLKEAGILSVILTAVFLIAVSVSLARGLQIDCGCFDVPLFGPSTIGWHTVLRNIILVGLSLGIVRSAHGT